MNLGEHMELVTELVNDLTHNDTEMALKLQAFVIARYMLKVDCTEFEVDTGTLNVSVSVSVSGEG
jgi:hypothetical protein